MNTNCRHCNPSQGVALSGFKLTCKFCRPNNIIIINVIRLPKEVHLFITAILIQAESLTFKATLKPDHLAVVCHSVVATQQI